MSPEYAFLYQRLYQEHWWWQSRAEMVNGWLSQLKLPEHGDVLDVGCGGGWGFQQWRRFGEVFGIEPNLDLVRLAGNDQNRIFAQPFDNNFDPARRFRLILMLDVLEHLENPIQALQHASALLVPGGTIFITVPALPSLWTSHDEINHHYVRYTRQTLLEVVGETELDLVRSHYFFHGLVFPKLLIRLKEKVLSPKHSLPKISPPWVNALLRSCVRTEHYLLSPLSLPFGSSLAAVLTKPL